MYRILYRFLASLARLTVRSGRSKDLEIIVLRHQLGVLRRQVNRPEITDADRSLLGAIAAALPGRAGCLVTPDTLLRWHRRHIVGHWAQPQRPPGRPSTSAELRRLTLRLAAENPTWRYRHIDGELFGLGHTIAASTIWRILKNAGIEPTPTRSEVTWSEFLRPQAGLACDFATVDTVLLRRFHLLFFIEVGSRSVYFGRVTEHPAGAWTTPAARNLFLHHADGLAGTHALVRDHRSQFTRAFDEIFRTQGCKVLKTPLQRPVANAFAERWIATLRRELLDRTIIWNQHQLQRLVIDYIDGYNTHRPYRSLAQRPPDPPDPPNQPYQQAPRSREIDTMRRTRQRVPTCGLTSHDRVSGTHRPSPPGCQRGRT